MKKCPSCQKTFEDNMKFCQSDGTPLVVVAEEEPSTDPYKTMVAGDIKFPPEGSKAGSPDTSEAPPAEAGSEPADAEDTGEAADVLEIPDSEEPDDPMQTVVVSGADTDDNIKVPEKAGAEEPQPGQSPESGELELGEGTTASEADTVDSPKIPKFSEPEIEPPDLFPVGEQEDVHKIETPDAPDAPDVPDRPAAPDAPDSPESKPSVPIPSPFDKSMPPGVIPPAEPLHEKDPIPVPEPEPEPIAETATPPSTPFEEEAPETPGFGAGSMPSEPAEPAAVNVPVETAAAEPDPFGDNAILSSAQPADPAAEGENKTMAFVSLGLGIASFICGLGFLGGIGAIITGYLAKKNISENPAEYGGSVFATIGMVLGVLAVALTLLLAAVWIILIATQGF